MIAQLSWVLAILLLFASRANALMADDYAIEYSGKTLQVAQATVFFSDASVGDTHGAKDGVSGLWDMAGPPGIESPASRGRKNNRLPLSYDGDGKTKNVETGLSKHRWILKSTDSGITF